MTPCELTGNNLTKRMHRLTLKELERMGREKDLVIGSIEEEKRTMLPLERKGSYDFLVESGKGLIGIEVMTRPTKGKLKEKLRYKGSVDLFVFVLSSNCLGLYRKTQKHGLPCRARPKFFPADFRPDEIMVWLLDATRGQFTEKGAFAEIFNVAR
ncbi:MAG: hypothetical protein NT067_03810 [Candidatus Diapherotrites archaeon]|nr:hypothetical protein [Candidatus Diapherotrites archaeon]